MARTSLHRLLSVPPFYSPLISPLAIHQSFYQFQQLYAPVVYVLLGTSVRIGDVFRAFIDKTRGPLTVNPFSYSQLLVFWGGKVSFQDPQRLARHRR